MMRVERWRVEFGGRVWSWGWLLVATMLAGPVLAEPRTALVIGNGKYPEAPLENPVNDARDLAQALRELGFEVIHRENLDRRRFTEVVSQFAQQLARRGGVGLFYYAGHGVQVHGQNYLIPVQASIRSEADVEFEAVDAGQMLRNMEQAGNPVNIVILDACRDNPFRGWFRSKATRGLAQMEAPTGSLIAYATGPGMAADDGTGRNSPYTGQLLSAIRMPGLSIEQVFKRVRVEVMKATGNRQVPWESTSLRGDFYFLPAQADERPRPETPAVSSVLPSPYPAPVPAPAPSPGAALKPGQVFRDTLSDGTRGPEMVVIAAGEFRMGSPESEEGRDSDERQHKVRIEKPFAMGKYEVTVREFRRFVEATEYRTEAERGDGCYFWGGEWKKEADKTWRTPGFTQDDNHPVVCVSWNDALAYVNWLSRQTGQPYRLPTEAEWEYAARARTATARYWGESADQGCEYANGADLTAKQQFSGEWTAANCRDEYVFTAPVGHYRANAFGLFDVLGNVWEWTCSEYEADYRGGEGRCASNDRASAPRVIRGGSWGVNPRWVRAANRNWGAPDDRNGGVGFRLARTLTL